VGFLDKEQGDNRKAEPRSSQGIITSESLLKHTG